MTEVSVYPNYLEYMRSRVSFRGKHNRRKSLIFLAISHSSSGLTSRQVYNIIGDCSYSALRSSLSRLLKLKYITVNYSRGAGRYHLLVKGKRFLLAARSLSLLHQWSQDAVATCKARGVSL